MKGKYGGMKECCHGQPSGHCMPSRKKGHGVEVKSPRKAGRHLVDGRKEKSRAGKSGY